MKNKKIYLIVLVATMAAMAIALDKIGSLKLTQSIKITFYAIPLMVVGILHGPKLGALTGLISGIILQLTSEYGINLSSIFFGLAPVVWGFVSGLVFKVFSKIKWFNAGYDNDDLDNDNLESDEYVIDKTAYDLNKDSDNITNYDKPKKSYGKIIILYFLAIFFASVAANLSNTFAMFMDSIFIKDSYYTGAMILVDWPGRLLTMTVAMVPYTFICFVVCDRIKAFLSKDKE